MQNLLQRLYNRQNFGIKLGLDTMRALMGKLENPENEFRAIHVAGTNGKGSVTAMLSSIFSTAGIKVGTYTSPHLIRINERLSINGQNISDDELNPLLTEIEKAAKYLEQKQIGTPTFFECITAAALLWFKRNSVDIAVIETGMGGRLDATNIITPEISVITKISLDHTEYLGKTIEDIAREKAGIIKFGVPVVYARTDKNVEQVITKTADALASMPICADDYASIQRISGNLLSQKISVSTKDNAYKPIKLNLAASYQVENVALVIAAIEMLYYFRGTVFSNDNICKGLSNAVWRGRFQCISDTNPITLVDGAHNQDGAKALVRALHDAKADKKVRFVVGQCSDKDSDAFFKEISHIARKVWTVPINNERSASPAVLKEIAKKYRIEADECENVFDAISMAQKDAADDSSVVVICGSLFLVGEVLSRLSK